MGVETAYAMDLEAPLEAPLVPAPGLSAADSALLEWQDLRYSVRQKGEEKPILRGVSGHAAPGTLTAILGASGAGKSSLLNALADRVPHARGASLRGRLLVNGEPAGPQHRARCAYVMQTEALYPFSTVRETVEVAARLRLGAAVPRAAKEERAAEVARVLGLAPAMDTRVGDGVRVQGLSGGERKRLGIACELVAAPSLVLLDEPTSGLDSYQALNVLASLKALAERGHTVICSIHQPGSALYSQFDQVYVVAQGECAYFGPAGDVVPHFSRLGLACPNNFNPADHLLACTSVDFTTPETEAKSRARVATVLAAAEVPAAPAPLIAGLPLTPPRSAPLCEQFRLLLARCWRDASRNKFAIAAKVGGAAISSLILCSLYKDMGKSQVVGVLEQNTTALLFFVTINGLFGPLFGTVQAFAPEVSVVLRERAASLYSTGPYYFAKVCVSAPFELLPIVLGNTVSFWLLDLNHTPEAYLLFLLFCAGMAFSSIGISFILAVLAEGNVQAASAGIGPIAIILLLLGGFYINVETIPVFIRWLAKVSYLSFAYQGLCISQFADRTLTVGGVVADHGVCPPGSEAQCMPGSQVLDKLFNDGVPRSSDEWEELMWRKLAYILACVAVFNLVAYLVLCRKGPKYVPRKEPQDDAAAAQDDAAVAQAS